MPQTVTHVSKKTENSKEVIKSIEALRRNIQFVSKEKTKKRIDKVTQNFTQKFDNYKTNNGADLHFIVIPVSRCS